jgi:hypothetical protein
MQASLPDNDIYSLAHVTPACRLPGWQGDRRRGGDSGQSAASWANADSLLFFQELGVREVPARG